MDDIMLLVEDNDCAGEEPCQRAVCHENAVCLVEPGVTECGKRNDIVDAFRGAEPGVGERKIFGDGQNHGILHAGGKLVELAHGSGAHPRVEAWKNVEDHSLAGELRERYVLECGVREREIWCPCSYFGEGAIGVDFMSLKCYCCHILLFLIRILKNRGFV